MTTQVRVRLLAVVLCVGCGSGALEAPEALDFGDVAVGGTVAVPLVLRNSGSAALTLSVAIEPATHFAPDGATVLVPAGSSATLSVLFTPSGLGRRSAFLTLRGEGQTASVALSGRGVGPSLFVDPEVLLAPVPRLAAAPTPTAGRIWVRNVGNATVKLGAPTADSEELCVGTFAAGVCQPWAPVSLEAGAALTVPFELLPSSAGPSVWTVSFPSDDPLQPIARTTVRTRVEDFEACQLEAPNSVSLRGGLARITVRHTGAAACLLREAKVVSTGRLTFTQQPTLPIRLTAEAPYTFFVRAMGNTSGVLRLIPFGGAALDIPIVLETLVDRCLVAAPDMLDFGTVRTGCGSVTRNITLYNVCGPPIALQLGGVLGGGLPPGSAQCPGPGACTEFSPVTNVSVSLTNQAPAMLTIRYRPLDVGQDQGEVLLSTTGAQWRIPISGVGGPASDPEVETFWQSAPPKIDSLFVIDASPSFVPKRAGVRANIQALLEESLALGNDARVSLAPAEGAPGATAQRLADGAGETSFPVRTAADVARILAVFDTLPVGSETEACIRPAAQLVGQPGGAPRPGAFLAGVCITDALEQSADPTAALGALRALAPSLSWNPVVGSAGCAGESLDDGLHAALAGMSWGTVADLCAPNWAATYSPSVLNPYRPQTTFFLKRPPDLSAPIEVRIDGQLRPSSEGGVPVWSFDPTSNAVVFVADQVPANGSAIEIRYTAACN